MTEFIHFSPGAEEIPEFREMGIPLVHDLASVSSGDLADTGCFLVSAMADANALHAIQCIRQHPMPLVYLKPIALVNETGQFSKRLEMAVDIPMALNDFIQNHRGILPKANVLCEQIRQLPGFDQPVDTNIALKILRHLFIRKQELSPIKGVYSRFGYHYPQVDPLFTREDGSLDRMLEFLEGQNLLKGEFIDKAYFCSNCHSAFLNFREICPQCRSARLNVQDVFHHFHCAYTGPVSDFEKGEKLVCPKCRKELKHIGVDYDRPSIIHICRDCDFATQDPEIDTVCYHCERNTIPENLLHLEIKTYELTAIAENAALFGLENLLRNIMRDTLKIKDLEVFRDYLSIEVARIRRYKLYTSCLCLLHIENLDEIYLELGQRSRHFLNELSEIIKKVLRTSDIIASYNDSVFLILLTETPVDGGNIAMNRLRTSIEELLKHNLQKQVAIHTVVQNIDGKREMDELLEEVIRNGMG